MISITLGLIILAALVTVFSQNSRSFRQNDAAAEIQDNARFAMEALSRDLMMAGYLGGLYDGAAVTVPSAPGNDCGSGTSGTGSWAFQPTVRLDPPAAASTYPCLSGISVVAGATVLGLRRANGQSAADIVAGAASATLAPQVYFLETNGTVGNIRPVPANGTQTPAITPASYFQWIPRLYFIRDFAHTPGDGIRALCRMELVGTPPKMTSECLADGIEDLQIEWGLDTDGDSIPDLYTLTPGAAIAQARTARIWLLVATTQTEAGFTDTKLYSLAGKTPAAPRVTAGIHHRVYVTTVKLRN